MLIVMKFGGTSVGSAARIREAALLALRSAAAGHRVVVVTSAMSGVTNQLIAAAESAARGHWEPAVREAIYRKHEEVAAEVIGDPNRRAEALGQIARRLDQLEKLCFGLSMVHELTPRLLDAISGIGECLSAPLLAGAIASAGQSAVSIEASELIVTNDQFGSAEPIMGLTREKAQAALVPLLDAGIIPVVTGFIAATGDGVTTTLGRGGSDYSASILGAVLDADEIWIWTDVNGVMSANPAEVPEARTLREISYSEAAEMAFYGAKVLHYKTILPACEKHIPVLILNSFNPGDPGTRVTVDGRPSSRGVKAVTSFRNVSMITISGRGMQGIPGIAARAFGVVASERASLMMISQASSANNLSFVVGSAEAARVVRVLRQVLELDLHQGHIDSIEQDDNVAVVAVVGDRMRGVPGIAGRVFAALGENGVNVVAISQGSSELNISLIVTENQSATAVRAIHQTFRLDLPSQP